MQFCHPASTDTAFWTHQMGKPRQNTWYGLAFERICMLHIDMRIRTRIADFVGETKIRHGVLTTLITTFGLRPNPYSSIAQVQLTMDDLCV